MSYPLRGLRLTGLGLVILLGMLMLAADTAQAEGSWRAEGQNIGLATLAGEQDSELYAFLAPGRNIELVFKKFSMDEGKLLPNGESYKVLLFSEGELFTMFPLEPVQSCGVGNLTFKVKSKLVLHGGQTYELVQPFEGTNLTVTTYTGEECFLPKTVPVTGSLILEDPKGYSEEAVTHLVQQASGALFGHGMFFGGFKMSLDGSMSIALSGEHEGLAWSGLG